MWTPEKHIFRLVRVQKIPSIKKLAEVVEEKQIISLLTNQKMKFHTLLFPLC